MRFYIFFTCLLSLQIAGAQELYVYSEPASNMPAKSVSFKMTGHFMPEQLMHDRPMQRYIPELMVGINKNWMVHLGTSFSDIYTPGLRWESVYLYGKYRFLSNDDLHSHFRMAVFGEAAYTRNPFMMDEVSLQGDKSGILAGVIATQLWHKFALSGTVSHTQVLHQSRSNKEIYFPERTYQTLQYSLSGGYLLLPREYTDYRQLNINLYAELLAQQSLDRKLHYIDLAPAVQLIIASNLKLNLGYRFQLDGNMSRMAEKSWLVSLERTFLNAFPKRKKA
jgi:hypothetical protein